MNSRKCKKYLEENYESYLVEYRGDFIEQINKVDYACGDTITDTLAVVAVQSKDLSRLRKDVPAINFIEVRSLYVLQDLSPTDVDNINAVKINPYLNLNGRGVVVGIIDTGVNYLNKEFIREDDTSRILSIWDQTIESDKEGSPYIGTVYSNEEINRAIQASLNGEDPYAIVNSKDEIGHGTEMAGIIGARGYNGEMQGIANDCEFIVIKLLDLPVYRKEFLENNFKPTPIYNNTEVLSAIQFARDTARVLRKPLVLYLGVGSTDGSHDGYNLTARYIADAAGQSGTIYVIGTGNQGNAEGHVKRFINNNGEINTVELNIPIEMKYLSIDIWVQKPNRMSLSIISPNGEDTGFFVNQILSITTRTFYLINTEVEVQNMDPEALTGHQLFVLNFKDIKPGIWKFRLRAEYVVNGRFDIWLPPKEIMPEGTKFLDSNPENTLTIPSTAVSVVTVSYYNGATNAIMAESGRGFNTNNLVNPDIATVGTDVLTISKDGNRVIPVSGSSVATAIVSGVSALLAQWAFIDQNDLSIGTTKVRSFFIYAASRDPGVIYPNEELGYGKMDILEVFNILSGTYKRGLSTYNDYTEDYMGELYIRKPKSFSFMREGIMEYGGK